MRPALQPPRQVSRPGEELRHIPRPGEAFKCFTCEQPTAVPLCKNITHCKPEATACKTTLVQMESGEAGPQGLGSTVITFPRGSSGPGRGRGGHPAAWLGGAAQGLRQPRSSPPPARLRCRPQQGPGGAWTTAQVQPLVWGVTGYPWRSQEGPDQGPGGWGSRGGHWAGEGQALTPAHPRQSTPSTRAPW